jgi:hypothetical protein
VSSRWLPARWRGVKSLVCGADGRRLGALNDSLGELETTSHGRRVWIGKGCGDMDHDAMRETYPQINDQPCKFEKSILAGQCGCCRVEKLFIGEREGLRCADSQAMALCGQVLAALRDQARFALRNRQGEAILSHAKSMRVQVGGLRGIAAALRPHGREEVSEHDVYTMIQAAFRCFGELADWPHGSIVKEVSAYQGRSRRRRR